MPRSRLAYLLVCAILLFATAAQPKTQASCTFTYFGLSVNIPNLGGGFIAPAGINDYGTIVGLATPSNDQITYQVAFVRWANGGFSFPLGTGSGSGLADRNDSGISIGDSGGAAVLVTGTTVTDITLNGVAGPIQSASGINLWGSIVGTYYTDFPNGLTGFKRWSNGGLITLNFPGGLPTTPMSINDNGVVVGSYSGGGFIYHSGSWATLNFPKSTSTQLVGIDNAGAIIGNALMPDSTTTPFLYESGTFKIISVPGAAANSTRVFGISPKLGLILGTAGGMHSGGFVPRTSGFAEEERLVATRDLPALCYDSARKYQQIPLSFTASKVRPVRISMMKLNDSVDLILKEKPGNVWSISPNQSVYEAIHEMADKQVGALLVISDAGLVGIISERDYARKVILMGRSSKNTQVKEIMTSPVLYVTPTNTLDECMALMTEHRIRHLPVMSGRQVVGVLSIGDLVKWIISAQEATIRHLEQYITGMPSELVAVPRPSQGEPSVKSGGPKLKNV